MKALTAFCALLVCVRGSAGPAPLPEGIELEPRGEATVIVYVGGFSRDIPWREITALLPVFAGVGADTLALWPVWAHIGPTGAIPVRTPTGPRDLRVGPEIHHWVPTDYTAIDPHRGTGEEFRQMVETAHSLGLKVIGQLQVSLSTPGDFIYEEHPEWMLESIYGEPALIWPWAMNRCGFQVNKAHPGLIGFVTEAVVPRWILDWGLDGIYLDSPGMAYCDPEIAALCGRVGPAPGYGCLTPVEGHTPPSPWWRR